MAKIREGDIVTFKAVVTKVAAFGKDQQIMARIKPNGEEIGWCVPHENGFEPHTLTLKVGDRAKWSQRSTDPTAEYEILFLTEHEATVKKVGNWNTEVASLSHLRRI